MSLSFNVILFVLILVLILLVVCFKTDLGKNLGITGGFDLGDIFGGKDANGYFYINEEKLDKLNLEGSGTVKGSEVKGDTTVKGSLDTRVSQYHGKTHVTGSLDASTCEFADLTISGYGSLFKSKAKKVTICGKFRGKGSDIDELIIDPKCELTGINMPYVKLHNCNVAKITLPKGMKEEEVISRGAPADKQ
jgi:hypothetical protein